MAPEPARVRPRHWAHWAAFGWGAGLSPVAPGTVASALVLPLHPLLATLPAAAHVAVLAALFVAGVWLTGRTARDLAVGDHPGIVWDEFVGQLTALIVAPAGAGWLVAGFVLFRFFDIVKPFPVGWLDHRVQGGWGIMLDDLAAGALAAVCLLGLEWGVAWTMN